MKKICIVAILLTLSVFSIYCSKKSGDVETGGQEPSTSTPAGKTASSAPAPADASVQKAVKFTSQEHLFHVTFPAGWKVVNGSGRTLRRAYNDEGSSITVSVRDYGDENMEVINMSNNQIYGICDDFIGSMKRSYKNTKVDERDIRSMGKHRAGHVKVTYLYGEGGSERPMVTEILLTFHKGKMYSLMLICDNKHYPDARRHFTNTSRSFGYDDDFDQVAIQYAREAEGKRYHNRANGFSIEFPQGWAIKENYHGVAAAAIAPKDEPRDQFQERLVIGVQDAPPGATKEALLQMSIDVLSWNLRHFDTHEEGVFNIDDRHAIYVVYSGWDNSLRTKGIMYMFVERGKLYTIAGASTLKMYDRYFPVFQQSIKTFRFEGGPSFHHR